MVTHKSPNTAPHPEPPANLPGSPDACILIIKWLFTLLSARAFARAIMSLAQPQAARV